MDHLSNAQFGSHIIKAQLPHQQRTIVHIPAGMTVREALGKALSMRNLDPETCVVYKYSPQTDTKQKIDWDVNVSMLRGDEVIVETNDLAPVHSQLSHNFESYFALSKCNFCQERLMFGYRCVSCGIEFHKTCSESIPPLCEPTMENRNLFRHLLARSNGFSPELLEERWEIDGDEITREEPCIGRGSFGTVYKGKWHGPVALKELNIKNPTPAQLEAFQNEVVVLKSIRHINVMLFMGYVLKPALTIVTQWCEGRSLYKHLHVDETPSFPKKKKLDISRGVAQGMDYLHARKIIHRDLKSSNIFLHDDFTVKIGDFGLATVKTRWEGNTQKHHPTGSVQWMAPEIIRARIGDNPFTFKADVYSYGNVLYELLTRRLPYFDFEAGKEALMYQIGIGMISLNMNVIEPDKPKGLKALMMRCIQREAKDRPFFKEILRELEKIEKGIPKLQRSTSEPIRLTFVHSETLRI